MHAFKNQCVLLRRKGHSITEIARITGRNKSSIYPHIRNIPLSSERVALYRRKSGEHIRQFALKRKGKSSRTFRKFETWTPSTTLLIAHLLFDGEISRGTCVYNNRSEALILRVRKQMSQLYDYEPRTYMNPVTGVTRLAYFNVALSAYLKKRSEELLANIRTLQKSHKKEFLRAFFDDEGCMDFREAGKRKRIRGYQKNQMVLQIVQELLADFDIISRVILPNEVVISGKQNLKKFKEEINFSPGVRINGNRSNSIWKEHLEKRELLDRAIASFKT